MLQEVVNMCFSTPKVAATAPLPAAPTAVNTGDTEAMADAKDKDRKRQRAAAGYQQNILSGSQSMADSNVGKKQLLGG
jgi:hypothetical protein